MSVCDNNNNIKNLILYEDQITSIHIQYVLYPSHKYNNKNTHYASSRIARFVPYHKMFNIQVVLLIQKFWLTA